MSSFLEGENSNSSADEDINSITESFKNHIVIQGEVSKPPFNPDIHILTPLPTEEQRRTITEFRDKLKDNELFTNYMDWANELQLQRFLIARNYNIEAAYKLITDALTWREKRKPHEILANMDEWNEKLSKENETGKIYCPGMDRWGRSIVVFHNEVQNTKSSEDHMNFLAWNLEFASSLLNESISDKYIIFCNVMDFSVWSAPSFSETLETIQMLTTCFPERLGHFICYQPPLYFKTVFRTVRSFLDQRTVNKIVFLSGSTEDGGENDILMKGIIGDDWKKLCGVDQPVLVAKSSPGFDHAVYWPTVLERVETIKSNKSSANTSEKLSSK